jgi:hypothetical protein
MPVVLAVSSWTWAIVAAVGLLSIGILIQITIGLIVRLKDFSRTISTASETLQEALGEMREDLDRTTEGLAGMRRHAGDETDF